MRKKRKWKYLHLLNGQPASFDGTCVCFTNNSYFFPKLEGDLRTVRRQQEASKKHRGEVGFSDDFIYHYQRIEP